MTPRRRCMSMRLAATSAVCVTKSTTHDVNSIPWKYKNGDSAGVPYSCGGSDARRGNRCRGRRRETRSGSRASAPVLSEPYGKA